VAERGPAPKPTQLKILQGTWRPDRANPAEVSPAAPADLSALSWLSDGAQDKWSELAPTLARNGLLTECDLDALALYCSTWERWRAAEDAINQHGSTTVAQSGYSQVGAHTTLAKQYRSDLLKRASTPRLEAESASGISPRKTTDYLHSRRQPAAPNAPTLTKMGSK
jgi:P27 family predicted phage terminase small subunit